MLWQAKSDAEAHDMLVVVLGESYSANVMVVVVVVHSSTQRRRWNELIGRARARVYRTSKRDSNCPRARKWQTHRQINVYGHNERAKWSITICVCVCVSLSSSSPSSLSVLTNFTKQVNANVDDGQDTPLVFFLLLSESHEELISFLWLAQSIAQFIRSFVCLCACTFQQFKRQLILHASHLMSFSSFCFISRARSLARSLIRHVARCLSVIRIYFFWWNWKSKDINGRRLSHCSSASVRKCGTNNFSARAYAEKSNILCVANG